MYFTSTKHRSGRRRNNKYFRTSRCSRGVRETTEEAAAAKDDNMDYRAKQAVLSRRVTKKTLLFCRQECIVAYTVCSFFSGVSLVVFVWLICNFPNQVLDAKTTFSQGWERLGCTPDAGTAVPRQQRAASSRFASTKGILCSTLPLCPPHDMYLVLFFFDALH